MKVLAWVPYPLGIAPAQRYRIEQWSPYLRELGIDVTFEPFATPELQRTLYQPGHMLAKAGGMARSLARRMSEALRANQYDAVLLQREGSLIGPAWSEPPWRCRSWGCRPLGSRQSGWESCSRRTASRPGMTVTSGYRRPLVDRRKFLLGSLGVLGAAAANAVAPPLAQATMVADDSIRVQSSNGN